MSRRSSWTPSLVLRRRLLLGFWLATGAGLLARSVQVQVLQGDTWTRTAERQHRRSIEIPAPRGRILDRDGTPLAVSHERLRVAVAPREVTEPDQAAARLVEALDLDEAAARRIVTSSDPWVVLRGSHPPAIREALGGVGGIHLERELERLLPHGDLALGLLGRVREGSGAGGVEQSFDEVLSGSPGREVQARDNVGRPIPGRAFPLVEPRSGGEVVLTLDLELQEIGREALAAAVEETGARGGDLLITDPRSGEILAMVSRREGASGVLSAVNAPYEPGSTLKPFTVSGLLARDLVNLGDTVDTGDGRWTVNGRTLTDVGPPQGRVTVARALQSSSNVGVAMAARAYQPSQQYETLRDFGFGAPTGLELPGEAAGTLRRPEDWSSQSQASLAIGYEVAVTPIQMAMAYGALANGGWLMEPRIVREIRGPDGAVRERRSPRKIRRAVPEAVARRVGDVLVDVVEDGTGTAARLSSFRVAGKSGTSRAYSTHSGYDSGEYFSSFVGFFPAEDPQLVVFVKLERPEGAYYGGATAAPVTRATLEAILAARRAPLDRRSLVTMARRETPGEDTGPVRLASRDVHSPPRGVGPSPPAAGRWSRRTVDDRGSADAPEGESHGLTAVPVPDVSGLPLRVAVRRIHSQGLRVVWKGDGDPAAPVRVLGPEPGIPLQPGDTVELGRSR